MPKNNIIDKRAKDPDAQRALEAYKAYARSRVFNLIFRFLILIAPLALTSVGVLLALNKVGSETITIGSVVGGLAGLVASVLIIRFFEDRQQKLLIEQIRLSEKEFFEGIKRNFALRFTEKGTLSGNSSLTGSSKSDR